MNNMLRYVCNIEMYCFLKHGTNDNKIRLAVSKRRWINRVQIFFTTVVKGGTHQPALKLWWTKEETQSSCMYNQSRSEYTLRP